jgi:hypothetical protein
MALDTNKIMNELEEKLKLSGIDSDTIKELNDSVNPKFQGYQVYE